MAQRSAFLNASRMLNDSTTLAMLENENAQLRKLVRGMYKSMDVSCQFGLAIPASTMAHVKNRAIGLGVEVDR